MPEFLQSLNRWENLLFLVPIFFGFFFMMLQFVGAGLDHLLHIGGGAGVEKVVHVGVEKDVHVHVEKDVHVGIDKDIHVGVDKDVHLEKELGPGGAAPASPGLFTSVLVFFNLGRVPFTVVLMVLLFSFGILGLVATRFITRWDGSAGLALLLKAFPIAFVGSCLVTKGASQVFARYLPTLETKRVTPRTLLGTTAEVASAEVTADGGRAHAKDAEGDLFTVFCRLAPGAPAARRGEKVLLVDHDAKQNLYTVKPVAAAAESGPAAKP